MSSIKESIKNMIKHFAKMGIAGMIIGILALIIAIWLAVTIASKVLFHTAVTVNNINPFQKEATIITPWGTFALTDVKGEDLPCIGKLPGTKRVMASKDSTSQEVMYGVEGDKFDELKSYVTEKLQKCGYTKVEDSEGTFSFGAMGGVSIEQGYDAEFYNKDEKASIEVQVLTLKYNDKTYTFVSLSKSSEDYYEEETNETNTTENTGTSTTESVEITDTNAKSLADPVIDLLSQAFEDVKITNYGAMGPYYTLQLTYTPAGDFTQQVEKLHQALKDNGYVVQMYSVTADSAGFIFTKDNAQYTLDIDQQDHSIRLGIIPKQ